MNRRYDGIGKVSAAILLVLICSCSRQIIQGQGESPGTAGNASNEASLPFLQQNGAATQLMVDGKPYLIIGGELHNSTTSSITYTEPLWSQLDQMNLNTVLAAVTWQLFEPVEGQFDFEIIDYLIESAEKHDMRLIVIWFGSWKNGQSSYTPLWVRQDTERFPRVIDAEGNAIETISVFSEELLEADKRAYAVLSRRIAESDRGRRIIMMQPENEVGILGSDFDYSELGQSALSSDVPSALLNYLAENRHALRPELRKVWQDAGEKASGSWTDVFGDNIHAREFLLAWSYASFIGKVAEAGRAELDLPTFVNAWIVQHDEELPGQYPAGGPVSRVMDIYKAATDSIDFLSPDIYLADFKGITADYVREDNPLFVPESTIDASRAFYIIGEHNALGYSPFGVEDGARNRAFAKAYGVLHEIAPIVLEYQQKEDALFAVMRQGEETGRRIELDDLIVDVRFTRLDEAAYGIIARLSKDEFLIAGQHLHVGFESGDADRTVYIADVFEGEFVDGEWTPGRLMNGDETFHNERVRVFGRIPVVGPTFAFDSDRPPQPTADDFQASAPFPVKEVTTPGIYRVRLYER